MALHVREVAFESLPRRKRRRDVEEPAELDGGPLSDSGGTSTAVQDCHNKRVRAECTVSPSLQETMPKRTKTGGLVENLNNVAISTTGSMLELIMYLLPPRDLLRLGLVHRRMQASTSKPRVWREVLSRHYPNELKDLLAVKGHACETRRLRQLWRSCEDPTYLSRGRDSTPPELKAFGFSPVIVDCAATSVVQFRARICDTQVLLFSFPALNIPSKYPNIQNEPA